MAEIFLDFIYKPIICLNEEGSCCQLCSNPLVTVLWIGQSEIDLFDGPLCKLPFAIGLDMDLQSLNWLHTFTIYLTVKKNGALVPSMVNI